MPRGGITRPYPKSPEGKAHKRWEIANRRRAVALLLDTGCTQAGIAEALGVSEGTVSEDKQAIEEGLQEAAEKSLVEKVAREEAALDGDEVALRAELVEAESGAVRLEIYQTILALMRRRSDLVGLSAAERRRLEARDAGALDALLRMALEAPAEQGPVDRGGEALEVKT
jgi:transposase-like protein